MLYHQLWATPIMGYFNWVFEYSLKLLVSIAMQSWKTIFTVFSDILLVYPSSISYDSSLVYDEDSFNKCLLIINFYLCILMSFNG